MTAFPAGVYSNLTNLETLYLYDNDAPTIDEAAFANLPSLKNLWLQNQVISDGNGGGLPTGVFAGLTALEQLYLDKTGISDVNADWFTDLTSLTLLRLRNNAIETLPAGVFSKLTNLNELRLENNNIISLDAGIFDGLPLTSLDLSGNTIASLPLNFLINITDTTALTTFNLTGNDVAAGDGWEITNASWVSDGSEFGYQLHIGHALP